MKLHQVGLLARTIRPLRSSQLVWRGRYAVARKLPAPHIPLPAGFAAGDPGRYARFDSLPDVPLFRAAGPRGGELVRHLAAGEFEHLNRREFIGRQRPDWRLGRRTANRLWTITLHYHAWAYELAAAVRRGGSEAHEAEELLIEYLGDWIERCDVSVPGARDLAWNPYAISTRVGWWGQMCRLLGRTWFEMRPQFAETLWQSLWRQAEYVYRHLEWDLRGNHLLRDACGLAWAARLLDEPRARRWMARATRLALSQADEQILADGGHFERSPMYHLHVMNDVLTLASLVDDADARASLRQTWRRMAGFARWMRHPDGQIPLFNDAALGCGASPAESLQAGMTVVDSADDRAAALPRGGRHFEATGLVAWHGGRWSLFFDAGEVGPDCQPGHAHADSLTLECSVDGARLFIDPGTFAYDDDETRRYDRSTAAHNTVCVDGLDSSEVWHVFRVGARARPRGVHVEFDADSFSAAAAHDGYEGLEGAPRHARRVVARDDGPLEIHDRIDGTGQHRATGGWLIDPAWRVQSAPSGWELTNGSRRVRCTIEGPPSLRLSVERRPCHPEFGREVETSRLTWSWEGTLPLELATRVERIACTSSF